MNIMKLRHYIAGMFRAVILGILLLAAAPVCAAVAESSTALEKIRVVMDYNYPPYAFKNDQGQMQGIIIDQWRLWERETGISVEITGIEWAEAQRRMEAGEYDVIDTIFRNEKRGKIYDFTRPYAVISVPLFFHKDISGISEPEDAIGFKVAVKAGDSALEILRNAGITNIVEYPSYEKIIEAARDGREMVFTVDRPPALYFMNKMGILQNFRETPPMYHGEFHRAVLKGQTGLLETVENGFAAISQRDYDIIDARWMGETIGASPYLKYALLFGGIISAVAVALLFWLWTLKQVVYVKTRKLAMSEERHRSILQTAMSGIVLTDRHGRLLEVNSSYCQMSGYSEQELLSMSISQLELREPGDDIEKRIEKLMELGEARYESRHLRKDGTVFDVETSVQYRRSNGGECVAFLQDITRRKRTEQELIQKSTETEQFFYSVSHDLRSPLVTIKAFMGYLEKDLAEDNREQLAQDMGFIHGAADKMKLMLDELLELSRIGRIETVPIQVTYVELLAEIMEILAGVIKEHNVDIQLPDADVKLTGVRAQLFRIWQNLIENAIKYRRDDITPVVALGIELQEGEYVFSVRDNGIGIDPRFHSKVFGIFEKLNPKSSGAGLGLAMVQRIVEKYGGRIWVESAGEGQGSTFYFTLPGAIGKTSEE